MFTTLPESSDGDLGETETVVERWLTSDNPETLAMAYRRLTGELRDRALVRLQSIDGRHDLGGGVELRIEVGGVANGGGEAWLLNDERHRVDGPAIQRDGGVANGGGESWWLNGERHRVDGPAIQRDGGVANGGDEEWWLNGDGHRVDGPAEQWDGGVANGGSEMWYLNDERHRVDGPAVEFDGGLADGGSEEWWLYGKSVTKEDVMG